MVLTFPPTPSGYGLALGEWRNPRPIQVQIDGAPWTTAPYAKINRDIAQGTLTSPRGSRFNVVDAYRRSKDGFTVTRTVRVISVAEGEKSFSTRFTLESESTPNREIFLPGVAYRRNDGAPPRALAKDPDAATILVREDRLPLPIALLRNPATGQTAELVHEKPDGATFAGETGAALLTDNRLRFGSLGFINSGPAFQYPGTEEDRTYLRGGGPALRRHPLKVGFEQRYTLRFTTRQTESFANAVQQSWRNAFAEADPKPSKVNLDAVYRASMNLLAHYGKRYEGVPSIPFQVRLPDGVAIDTSSQMGFVGKALPCAALMLRDAVDLKDEPLRKQAEALIDFWVANSPNPSGVPKTWYDIHPGGTVTWRTSPSHLRIASDGMRGILAAYAIDPKPEWLAFAKAYGDFLVKNQAPDGSFAGLWNWDGTVAKPFKNATDHTIPLLVELYQATQDTRYRNAALEAGDYCLSSVHQAYSYVGGTADNPNVLDKEAGVLAMQAFLALYDLTMDRKWLAPASQAATFCETWTYAWNVPIPREDPDVVFPNGLSTVGLSLIATGHSAADDFMVLTVYDYYRLFKLTQDAHFLRFARFLQRSTLSLVDLGGSLGYAQPGLLMEALNVAPPRGHGVKGWLPWLTVGILEPMVRLRKEYGTYDLERL